MRFFCRIGLHRWSFSSQRLNEPGHGTHTEVVRARCRRDGCTRYGEWSLVHKEAHVQSSPGNDSPMRLA